MGRNGYQLLAETGDDMRCLRLQGKRRRIWKIKVMRKIKLGFKIVLQIKLLAKIREAYFNMMLKVVENVGSLNRESFLLKKRITGGSGIFNVSDTDDFESRLVFEVYKEIKASREVASQ